VALSIDPATNVIYIPKADLTLISGTLYELDVDAFRLELKNYEDSADGMVLTKTHNHNTEQTLAGLTYARTIEILSPYTVEFEDGQYEVSCTGANHNLSDVKVANQVSLIINNSAGLIVKGTGLTSSQDTALTDIKTKTDQITLTKSNELDVNVHSINNETIVGDGKTTPFNVP